MSTPRVLSGFTTFYQVVVMSCFRCIFSSGYMLTSYFAYAFLSKILDKSIETE